MARIRQTHKYSQPSIFSYNLKHGKNSWSFMEKSVITNTTRTKADLFFLQMNWNLPVLTYYQNRLEKERKQGMHVKVYS